MNSLLKYTPGCIIKWNHLRRIISPLRKLRFMVFGLGNKTYEHYNAVAIYLDKRLEELGATRVHELGLGDDDANIEDDFITWKDRFWPAVCEKFNIESTGEEELTRQFRLVSHQPEEIPSENVFTGEIARLHTYQVQRPPYDAKNPFLAQITVNRELHKGGDRSCLHVELDISESKMRYEAGDHVAIYPINDTNLVDRLGALTKADMDEIFSLINTNLESSKKHPFPCPTSYRTALSHYLEITAVPRTHILRELAEYCSDEEDKKKLLLMATNSQEGKELYHSFVVDACRNIVHILEDIKSCKPPLDHLCELLPRLQPRYYSISSSPKLYPETVHITAVVVEYKTSTGRVNKGVATTWLAQHKPEAGKPLPRVPVYIRKSQFRLPLQTQTPIIMVGPGTGFAPFRGFLQERALARANGKEVGENILYYGCRHRDQDYIYQEELEKYEKDGDVQLNVAFSRDQEHKVYVTHLLQNNIDKIWDVIGNRNGHFYVCGDAKNMAVDVRNIVLKAVQEKGGRTEAEAAQFLKKLDSMKKYSSDVWRTTSAKRKKGRDSSSGGSDENDNHDKTHVMPRSFHANIGQASHSSAESVNIPVADYSSPSTSQQTYDVNVDPEIILDDGYHENDLGRYVGLDTQLSTEKKREFLQHPWIPPRNYDFESDASHFKRKFNYAWLDQYAPSLKCGNQDKMRDNPGF
ncbi:hypothetical protein evm_002569 [Chilo suppressalis]|nr:hypothetical protein evm_002569 [Chilo suppressalis]